MLGCVYFFSEYLLEYILYTNIAVGMYIILDIKQY